MEQCSEALAYKIQTPSNHPEECIQNFFINRSFCMLAVGGCTSPDRKICGVVADLRWES